MNLQVCKGREISIHASRGGSDKAERIVILMCYPISIHASRGGSDVYPPHFYNARQVISIHASRGGSDLSGSG